MPELPEVEAIRRALSAEILGLVVEEVSDLRLQPQNPTSERVLSHIFHPFAENAGTYAHYGWSEAVYLREYRAALQKCFRALSGMQLFRLTRRGKYLLLCFAVSPPRLARKTNAAVTETTTKPFISDSLGLLSAGGEADLTLVIHLRMAGQLLVRPAEADFVRGARHQHLALRLTSPTSKLTTASKHSSKQSAKKLAKKLAKSLSEDLHKDSRKHPHKHERLLVYRDTRFGHILPFVGERALPTFAERGIKLTSAQQKVLARWREWLTARLDLIGTEPLALNGTSKDSSARNILDRLRVCKAERRFCEKSLYRFLMDSRGIAGMGNIYANEILHRSRLAPFNELGEITATEERRLATSIESILAGAVKHAGTSLDTKNAPDKQKHDRKHDHTSHNDQGDPAPHNRNPYNDSTTHAVSSGEGHFRLPDGATGGYACRLHVYGRRGEPCMRRGCAGEIARVSDQGRSVFHCPVCQPSSRHK